MSNPITQANASFKMRQSEDPRDRALATIQERLDSLENRTVRAPEAAPSPFHKPVTPNDIEKLKDIVEFARARFGLVKDFKQIENEIRVFALAQNMRLAKANLDQSGNLHLETETGLGFHTNIE